MKTIKFNLASMKYGTATQQEFAQRAGFEIESIDTAPDGKVFSSKTGKGFLMRVRYTFNGNKYGKLLFRSLGMKERFNHETVEISKELYEQGFEAVTEALGWVDNPCSQMSGGSSPFTASRELSRTQEQQSAFGWKSDVVGDEELIWDELWRIFSRQYAREVLAQDTVHKCSKCSGRGYIPAFAHVYEGICFDCLGSGIYLETVKVEL